MRALAPYPRGENVMRWKLTLAALAALAAAVTAVAATGPSLHETHGHVGRVCVGDSSLEGHLTAPDVHLEAVGRVPEGPEDHVVPDLTLDLSVLAHERPNEIGARHDPDELSVWVDDREAVDATVEHQRRGLDRKST